MLVSAGSYWSHCFHTALEPRAWVQPLFTPYFSAASKFDMGKRVPNMEAAEKSGVNSSSTSPLDSVAVATAKAWENQLQVQRAPYTCMEHSSLRSAHEHHINSSLTFVPFFLLHCFLRCVSTMYGIAYPVKTLQKLSKRDANLNTDSVGLSRRSHCRIFQFGKYLVAPRNN